MDKNLCSTCGLKVDAFFDGHHEKHHAHEHDRIHRDKLCKCHHNHHNHHHKSCDCCCPHHPHHSHHIHCRSVLCDDDFRLRLGGLQGGLNFRLRQLLGCKVEIQLENDEVMHGEICHVGSNFVELLVQEHKQSKPNEGQDPKEGEEPKEKNEQAGAENKAELCDKCKQHRHKKCKAIIIPTDKIEKVKIICKDCKKGSCECPKKCTCC